MGTIDKPDFGGKWLASLQPEGIENDCIDVLVNGEEVYLGITRPKKLLYGGGYNQGDEISLGKRLSAADIRTLIQCLEKALLSMKVAQSEVTVIKLPSEGGSNETVQ